MQNKIILKEKLGKNIVVINRGERIMANTDYFVEDRFNRLKEMLICENSVLEASKYGFCSCRPQNRDIECDFCSSGRDRIIGEIAELLGKGESEISDESQDFLNKRFMRLQVFTVGDQCNRRILRRDEGESWKAKQSLSETLPVEGDYLVLM